VVDARLEVGERVGRRDRALGLGVLLAADGSSGSGLRDWMRSWRLNSRRLLVFCLENFDTLPSGGLAGRRTLVRDVLVDCGLAGGGLRVAERSAR
jgi:hypothetical protein